MLSLLLSLLPLWLSLRSLSKSVDRVGSWAGEPVCLSYISSHHWAGVYVRIWRIYGSAPRLSCPPCWVHESMHPGVLSPTGSGICGRHSTVPPVRAREDQVLGSGICGRHSTVPPVTPGHTRVLGSLPFLPPRASFWWRVPRTGCMQACIRGSSRLLAQG